MVTIGTKAIFSNASFFDEEGHGRMALILAAQTCLKRNGRTGLHFQIHEQFPPDH